jgi:glucosamine--fructose-6-phosphate aminotransferase (isomerizing)
VVTVSDKEGNPWGGVANVQIIGVDDFAAWGVLFIYVCQLMALLKAVELGGNPDQPKGLDPYIKL